MKKFIKKEKQVLILLSLVLITASSCSTYQYTARQVNVDRQNIANRKQSVDIEIDYNKTVTATSDYQVSKEAALKEAEFKCLKENKIDVIIDPIVEYKINHFKLNNRVKATIIGFAGTYKKETPVNIDATKEYTREEIENYKLLTDPEFPQYLYNKGEGYSHSCYGEPSGESNASKKLTLTPDLLNKDLTQKKLFDYDKSKRLRNAGIGTTIAGALSCFVIGIPLLYVNDWDIDLALGYDDIGDAGAAFMTIGAAALVSGVPMWAIGSYRMKHSRNTVDLALTTTGTGIGLNINF